MATTYSNMSLKSWNLAGDFFSYTDLDANWSNIDAHDHTSGKGVQIPTGGIADSAVTTAKLASSAVDNSKISASAGIVDTKLASPNNGIWRTYIERYGLLTNSGSSPQFLGMRGSGEANETTTPYHAGRVFYFDPADFAVAGKTTKIRLRGWVVSNGVDPATSFTFRLSTVVSTTAFAGGIGTTTLSATAITNPGANAFGNQTSAELTAPVAGYYTLCCACTIAASSFVGATCQLQIRHV